MKMTIMNEARLLFLLSCIGVLIKCTDAGIHNNTLDAKGPEVNGNERNASADDDSTIDDIHPFRNDSAYGSSQTTTSSHDASANNSNHNGNVPQHGSNGHSTYYYNRNQDNNNQRMSNAKYDDEHTYLDLFGERAKELFTQHIIPSTDAECRWDWRMGRCEPYCSCGFQFLWGDYHFGRSCRYRTQPPPSQSSSSGAGTADEYSEREKVAEEDGTHWQEAWQEVWHSQLTDGAVDDVSSFVPPLFPKSHANLVAETTATTPATWDTSTCALPPESRYIQIIRQLTQAFTHSTVVIDNYQKLKSASLKAANTTMVHGRHHWADLRHKTCETVKRKVEERAKIRNQPVVLTKQGAAWIRRVCGPSSDDLDGKVSGDPSSYGSGAIEEDEDEVVEQVLNVDEDENNDDDR